MPQQAKQLDARLVAYLKSIDAQMAVPNPQYDPNRAPTPRKKGNRDGKGKGGKKQSK